METHYFFAYGVVIVKLSAVKKEQALTLCTLESRPEFFAQVAQWHHQECERQGLKSTLMLRQQRLASHMRESALPKTLIALMGNQLVGCVSLVDYTYRSSERMPKVTSTSPIWLSNLFVQPGFRQRGFGNCLIEAAKTYVARRGADELWLSATDYTDYYLKRGWVIIRRTRLGGRQVNVMRVALMAP